MPYRRLPNTNQARMRALKAAVDMGDRLEDTYDLAFSYGSLEDARALLVRYERAMGEYKQCSAKQVETSKKFQEAAKMARLYLSHFVQVLNMCVLRNEIKPEAKKLYGLPVDSYVVPDLISDENLYKWGALIIEGEQKRIQAGGTPIYNPAIAKVRVHYDIFVEHYNNQKVLQNNTSRTISNVTSLNESVDKVILDIWNDVEHSFSLLPLPERLHKCSEYGLVYYYRRGEAKVEYSTENGEE
ncbi:MAG: hypothetical protein J6Y37_11155 [Paludibacteraceae bacterium]|nr:hypothetical protein [Paludibacteraceae bacterium]